MFSAEDRAGRKERSRLIAALLAAALLSPEVQKSSWLFVKSVAEGKLRDSGVRLHQQRRQHSEVEILMYELSPPLVCYSATVVTHFWLLHGVI